MKCIVCGKKIESSKKNKWYPACSKKCDLYCWLNEKYVVSEPLPNVAEGLEEPEKFWRN